MKRIPLPSCGFRPQTWQIPVRSHKSVQRPCDENVRETNSGQIRPGEPENPSKFSPARSAAKKREGVKKTPSLS